MLRQWELTLRCSVEHTVKTVCSVPPRATPCHPVPLRTAPVYDAVLNTPSALAARQSGDRPVAYGVSTPLELVMAEAMNPVD